MNKSMLRRALLAAGIAALATFSFGNPHRYVADFIWPDDAAPWEKVTAVYTPDLAAPARIEISDATFSDVAACRDHVMARAAEIGDPNLEKGSFECAVGFYAKSDDNPEGSYRLIVK